MTEAPGEDTTTPLCVVNDNCPFFDPENAAYRVPVSGNFESVCQLGVVGGLGVAVISWLLGFGRLMFVQNKIKMANTENAYFKGVFLGFFFAFFFGALYASWAYFSNQAAQIGFSVLAFLVLIVGPLVAVAKLRFQDKQFYTTGRGARALG
mgnify:CR=1 FL=1